MSVPNINYTDAESGIQIKISDTHKIGLKIVLWDFSGEVMYGAESKLSREEDWSESNHGEHKAFILGLLNHANLDKSTPGAWFFASNP